MTVSPVGVGGRLVRSSLSNRTVHRWSTNLPSLLRHLNTALESACDLEVPCPMRALRAPD
jgi:hypothetical protein|tara:strand:- start:63 stop:242 length:180 start_codon:yes stop_codon:yes gene_type:complete